MRVLLDESLPRPLAELLTGHEARTVAQVRWRGLRNGVLLQQAAAAFDVVLTADQNVAFQQNLKTLPVAVVVLVAESNPDGIDARMRLCSELSQIQSNPREMQSRGRSFHMV